MDLIGDLKGKARYMVSSVMDRQTCQEESQMSGDQQAIFVLYIEHPQ